MTADPTPSPEAMRIAEKVERALLFSGEHPPYSADGRGLRSFVADLADAEFADLRDMLEALTVYGWTVEKINYMYDEPFVGWIWTDQEMRDHVAEGPHDQLPPWPESARKALAEQRERRKR